jgi:hypothetical protein
LDIVIWNLFGPILRSGVACYLLFSGYPGWEAAWNDSNISSGAQAFPS